MISQTMNPSVHFAEGIDNVKFGQAMCPYCGVGCLLDIKTRGNEVLELKGTPDSPVNQGLLCPKGALLAPIRDLPGRLLHPQIRRDRQSMFQTVTWERALTKTAHALLDILNRYGPDSIAIYGSGQLDTESWYVGNKLLKGHIGSNHLDSNSRLCMASAVASYNQTLGSDGPPTCYEDIDYSHCFLVAGSNMADTHPVLFQRIRSRLREENTTLIVIDPRLSNTAKFADIHVPVKPGGDIALFNAIGRTILDRGGVDTAFVRDHTAGYEEYRDQLCGLDIENLVEESGVSWVLVEQVVDAILSSENWLSFYCMGLGQSSVGTAKHNALINLHLMTGQIAKAGAGPFSLTGQPNAMGGRELGGLAHLLPGYRLIEDDEARHEVEVYWGVPKGSIHPRRGLTTVEMIQAMEQGRIKAIWVAGTNPLVSLPNLALARRAFETAELVIVQDCYETETTQVADIVLPVAQWIERDCTMTNSERRVTRNTRLIDPPGEARPDWWVYASIARLMGYYGFDYASSEEIWDEYRMLTAGRNCDMAGMTNERLREGPLQWPCPTEDHPGTARRYLDRRFPTPDGCAHFVPVYHASPQENTNDDYPLMLTTGRLASQWHTMTRTGRIERLARQAKTPYVEIHEQDATALDIHQSETVVVRSRRGQVLVEAHVSERLRPGMVFMPFHWGDLFAPGRAANNLTNDVLDPISKEPEFKACAVRLDKIAPVDASGGPS